MYTTKLFYTISFFFIVFGLAELQSVKAQTTPPEAFKYQAVARDANGDLMSNASVDIRIGIHSGSTTGPLAWEEEHLSISTNEFGLFTLQIGKGTSTGNGSASSFSAIDWNSDNYFLEVEMNTGSGYQNMGTSQLLSVPYALSAKRALIADSTLSGSSGGLSSVNTSPRISGDGTSTNPLDIAQQSAMNGQVLKWNGTNWTPAADQDTDSINVYTGGPGINISGLTINNTGDIDSTDDITNTTSAGGDLSGTYPNPTVVGLQNRPVSSSAPTPGQVLKWNGTNWAPADDSVNNYSAGNGLQLTGTTFSEGCPTGTADMGAFCVEINDRSTATFSNAAIDCGNSNMRLCSMSEYEIIMDNKAQINYNTNGFLEWVDDWTYDDGSTQEEVKVVYINGDFFSMQPPGQSGIIYRCCTPK